MFYYSGVVWGQSERPFLLVFLKNETFFFLAPNFEKTKSEELISQSLGITGHLYLWKEDESPYLILSNLLRGN